MQAAVEAREGPLRILAVTVLTSYDNRDLKAAGYAASVRRLAAGAPRRRARSGSTGSFARPEEAATLRAIVGAELALVTPGIRPHRQRQAAIRNAS